MEHNPKSMAIEVDTDEESTKGNSPSGSDKSPRRTVGRASRVSSRSTGKAAAAKAAPAPSNKPKVTAVTTAPTTKAKAGAGASRANRVRLARIERMMSKAELARRAGLSVLTIDRVEKGLECRMDTKRKILEALELSLADRVRVFGEEE